MAIELTRVPVRPGFLRRYTPRVSPPHTDSAWESPGLMTGRQVQNKLYDFGNHTADISDAFAVAEERWQISRTT